MTTIVSCNELVHRAVAYVIETHRSEPSRSYEDLIDEAAMRFNLSPRECESLRHTICQNTNEQA